MKDFIPEGFSGTKAGTPRASTHGTAFSRRQRSQAVHEGNSVSWPRPYHLLLGSFCDPGLHHQLVHVPLQVLEAPPHFFQFRVKEHRASGRKALLQPAPAGPWSDKRPPWPPPGRPPGSVQVLPGGLWELSLSSALKARLPRGGRRCRDGR